MNGAFYIGATGLDAQQRALEVTANNIANINTPAFKRSVVRFASLVTPALDSVDALTEVRGSRSEALGGVSLVNAARIWATGEMHLTGNNMDVAIDGNGFLELLGPNGRTFLWRGGTLKMNADGYLATADGTVLKSMISVPVGSSEIAIDREGMVAVRIAGEPEVRQLGQIELVMVKDSEAIAEIGGGYFEVSDPSAVVSVLPGEEGGGQIMQGAVEMANVQLSDEMVTLLLLQRSYAASAQVVQAGDQLMSIVNGLRR